MTRRVIPNIATVPTLPELETQINNLSPDLKLKLLAYLIEKNELTGVLVQSAPFLKIIDAATDKKMTACRELVKECIFWIMTVPDDWRNESDGKWIGSGTTLESFINDNALYLFGKYHQFRFRY